MTKSLIKKMFSFKKSKEQKQPLSSCEAEKVIKKDKYENDTTKNNQSFINNNITEQEQKEISSSTSQKQHEQTPHLEISSNKVIITHTIYEKKAEESSSTLNVEPQKTMWFERLKKGLSLSSQRLGDSISSLFIKQKLDEDTLQKLEDILIQSDLGLETTTRIIDALASDRYEKNLSSHDIHTIVANEIKKVLEPVAIPLELDLNHKPHVILLVGVNGTGKTTTIGKLAAKLIAGGLKVTLAAGDTFRAAAIEQLHIWGKRTGAPVISTKLGADAASLAFDAYEQAKKTNSDVLIIDTAGRLQNKTELMDELAKIIRVLKKQNPQAPHTVLQTLDATTGQNALNQVDIFGNIANVNGLVMTKLDGSARGGILVAIAAKFKLPVYFIGIGENIEDLEPFSASDFADAIAGRHS
ncbi:signal recognition particle-docking protein FtsY [Bartonella sp. F02]|uniref:signal recognition particle-docking protein FtsY n=1 Tax=Bartonella sp. F02 TaxID=2967262 RepID=UPI0022A91BEA|nr:signal recognition particle-docking protein FtsY [Bartonella sp. F02]MCZ2327920.1 signal recognition particle-docking protein FtsY [Bartonella sp. F02]